MAAAKDDLLTITEVLLADGTGLHGIPSLLGPSGIGRVEGGYITVIVIDNAGKWVRCSS